MASVTSSTNTNSRDLDPVVLVSSGAAKLKRAVPGSDKTASGVTPNTAAIEVGTHVDDAAFGPAVDTVMVIAGEADETATDSVDEGDAGALRMTLNRRLITAGQFLDDAAYTPAADYSTVMGGMADETSPDSVNEGDSGALRMTLDRYLRVVSVQRAGTGAKTNVNDTNVSTTILAANVLRTGATIWNDSTAVLYLDLTGGTASATSCSVKLIADAFYEVPFGITGLITGIWASDASGAARITEFTGN